jgi:hypothetical protein
MADNLLTPINTLISDTAQKILDTNITGGIADVLKSVIDSSVKVVDDSLKKIRDITKES